MAASIGRMSTTTEANPGTCTFTLSAEHQATSKVAARLHEMVSQGQNIAAIRELYDDRARHVEVTDGPGCGRITEGRAGILEKAEQFEKSITVHGATAGAPIVNGDQFICPMTLDATFKDGPMKGHNMKVSETVLYTVRNGKIVEAKFFYSMGC